MFSSRKAVFLEYVLIAKIDLDNFFQPGTKLKIPFETTSPVCQSCHNVPLDKANFFGGIILISSKNMIDDNFEIISILT